VSSRHFQVHRFLSDVPTRRKTGATFSQTTGQQFASCPMRDSGRRARRAPRLEKRLSRLPWPTRPPVSRLTCGMMATPVGHLLPVPRRSLPSSIAHPPPSGMTVCVCRQRHGCRRHGEPHEEEVIGVVCSPVCVRVRMRSPFRLIGNPILLFLFPSLLFAILPCRSRVRILSRPCRLSPPPPHPLFSHPVVL